jgi:hypothetical protein
MGIVTKTFDDEVYRLVPIDGIQSDRDAILFSDNPVDLPGVISHSGEPVAWKIGDEIFLTDAEAEANVRNPSVLVDPLFTHPTQASKPKPFCADCGKRTPVDSVHTCSPQAGEADKEALELISKVGNASADSLSELLTIRVKMMKDSFAEARANTKDAS